MFRINFNFELKSLLRSAWIQTLSVLLLTLCLFASYNGAQKVADRTANTEHIKATADSTYTVMLGVLDSVVAGLKTDLPPWQNPQTPSVLGNRYPKVAAFDAQPLALLATGQSDMYAHAVTPRLSGEALLLNFTELASPVQLLFGSFDLSFVFVYLLPLLVIAFSYNLLSAEREQGVLRLLLAQPMSVLGWLLQKSAIRFLVIAVVSSISLVAALLVSGVHVAAYPVEILKLIAMVLAYAAFWFIVAVLVNLAGRSSAQNTVIMLAVWIGLVLLMPSIVGQLANNLYPVPSRALLVNEVRVATAKAEKEADQILAAYYRDHPELMPDSSKQQTFLFWKQYFASQDLIREQLRPLIVQYDDRLAEQQAWVDRFRFASPAILLQDGFNDLAGTSSRHYQSFRQQVIDFAAEWRGYFIPIIFKGDTITREMALATPEFTYNSANVRQHFGANMMGLLLYCAIFLIAGLTLLGRSAKEQAIAGV